VCRAALMHEFVRDLLEGWEPFGDGGAALSTGKRQRLVIARTRLRNLNVLILGA
jgi:ABC-type bacteriocin/lantibiotic exporter with double-glycine peptidase domain